MYYIQPFCSLNEQKENFQMILTMILYIHLVLIAERRFYINLTTYYISIFLLLSILLTSSIFLCKIWERNVKSALSLDNSSSKSIIFFSEFTLSSLVDTPSHFLSVNDLLDLFLLIRTPSALPKSEVI